MTHAADTSQVSGDADNSTTKFRLVHDGKLSEPKLIDLESGEDVVQKFAIESLVYDIQVNDVPTTTVRLFSFQMDAQSNVCWQMHNPMTGFCEELAALEFRDGTRVEFDEYGRPGYRAGSDTVVLDTDAE